MTNQSTSRRVSRRWFVRSTAFVSAAVLLAVSSGAALEARNVVTPPAPLLVIVQALPEQPAAFRVHGEGFSQGGSVFLNVTGLAAGSLTQSFWTVASTESFGPNGSQDPAQGYVNGGVVDEWIELDGATVWGPNGSQDPAQGFREAGRAWCPGSVEVQAFDADTRTWSNRVQAAHSCQPNPAR